MATQTYTEPDERMAELCDALLFGGVDGASTIARKLVEAGQTQRSLLLDVLTPAARHLGLMWDQDEASFLSVNVGTLRVETIIRETAHLFKKRSIHQAWSAIFANVPGDEHTIGLKMAAELQRSKGWDIEIFCRPTLEALLSSVDASSKQILGLSIGSASSMHHLYKLVRALRRSRPDLKILISGSLVAGSKQSIDLLGVDACASNYEQAEKMLNQLAKQTATAR